MAAIFIVSGMPQPPRLAGISFALGHVAAYCGLAVLVVRALAGGRLTRITSGAAMSALLMTITYGVSDELHQLFVPGRTATIADVCADAAGAAIGVGTSWAWAIIRDPT